MNAPTTEAGRALWGSMTGGAASPFEASARVLGAEIAAIEDEAREDVLALLYADRGTRPAYVRVAQVCDEILDPSGALLGRVRDKARRIREEREEKG